MLLSSADTVQITTFVASVYYIFVDALLSNLCASPDSYTCSKIFNMVTSIDYTSLVQYLHRKLPTASYT